jgi:outer membrane usher protein
MTTGTRGRSRWLALTARLLAVSSGGAMPGQGDCAPPPVPAAAVAPVPTTTAPATEEELFLEVEVNQVDSGQLVRFLRREGRFYAAAADLATLGLKVEGAGGSALVGLNTLPGLVSRYHVAEQRLSLQVPVALLARPVSQVGYSPPPPPTLDPQTRAGGLLLNYELYGLGNRDYRSGSGWGELRLFGVTPGIWRSSAVVHATSGSYDNVQRSVRLDSSWQLDFPDAMTTVLVGDAISGSLGWTRSSRMGGVHVSRNFSLQPYRVTVPLASYVGETALPSTVDLYINGIREAQQQVAPGRFQVDSAPIMIGSGRAQVVITDITGQQRVVDFSIYNDRQMLQAGLSDWSLRAGYLRRGYGVESFAYSHDPAVSGSFRHGMSNALTAEAHIERMGALAMAGAGALLRLGRAGGVVSTSYARSRFHDEAGHQYSWGYEYQGRRLSLSALSQRRSAGFRDLASLEGSPLPRRTEQLFVGLNIGTGQLGASYVRQEPVDVARIRYASVTAAQGLGRYGDLHLSINRDLEGKAGTSAYLYWSLSLANQHHAWSGVQRRDGDNVVALGAMRALPDDADGWGWRTQLSRGSTASSQGEVSYLGRHGLWQAGVFRQRYAGDIDNTYYLSGSGGLLLMKRRLFPMRHTYDAFALVSTDGIAGVPVLLENRPIGNTDENGYLLLTRLNAWENNSVSIDPLVLPEDVSVTRTRTEAVPSTGAGMFVRFPMLASVMVQLAVRGPDGQWIPAGTPARLTGGDGAGSTTVGYDGVLYLENPPPAAQVELMLEQGRCVLPLPQVLPGRGWIQLGERTCQLR